MQKTNAPAKYTVPFAASGTKNVIPIAASPTPGQASYTTGFTAVNMEPKASGGIPPFGQDFNGIYYDVTWATLWKQAGFTYNFDGTYAANSAIGGYPAQALLARADGKGLWLSTADNNNTDPDASGAAGWLAVRANAGMTSIALATATTTPDPSLLGVPLLVLTGTLTANAAVVLPLAAGASWLVANMTTGAFNVTVKGATGAGVQVPQGSAAQCYTDGIAFYSTTANVSGLYLPINGNAVSASKLANARNFSITGLATAAAQAFDGTADLVLNVTALSVNTALGYTAANDANVVHTTGNESIAGTKTFGNGLQVANGQLIALGTTNMAAIYDATGGVVGIRSGLTGSSHFASFAANGDFTAGGTVLSTQNFQSTSSNVVLATTGTGAIVFRPNGPGSTSGQVAIDSSGNFVTGGSVQSGQNFQSSGTNVVVANSGTGGGSVYLRPNGAASATGNTIISAAGNMSVAGTITPGSDQRIKKNAKKIEGALKIVRTALVGHEYDRSDNAMAHQAGFIAQKVKKHLPHLIQVTESHGFKDFHSMDYNGAEAYMANAIVELDDELKALRKLVLSQAKVIEKLSRSR